MNCNLPLPGRSSKFFGESSVIDALRDSSAAFDSAHDPSFAPVHAHKINIAALDDEPFLNDLETRDIVPSESEPETDAVLLQRLCAHDFDALGVLFDRYYAQIYCTAMGITRDNAAAEDIAQDTFLKLHQYAHRIDTALPLSPWLYRVTVNLAYTYISRRQKRRVSLESLVDQLMAPARYAPEAMAERGETQRVVRQAISELHFNQRVVVVLHYLTGLSLEDIAEVLECPVGTVKSRLYYARENLRHRLGDHHPLFEVQQSYAAIG